jgi:hypothetical protein
MAAEKWACVPAAGPVCGAGVGVGIGAAVCCTGGNSAGASREQAPRARMLAVAPITARYFITISSVPILQVIRFKQ